MLSVILTRPFVAYLNMLTIPLYCEFTPHITVKYVCIPVSEPVIINNPCFISRISGLNDTVLFDVSTAKSLYVKLSTLKDSKLWFIESKSL